jgi:exopolysaccharide biosynthesis polyprenyl glycosylphosphotransferase
MNAHLVASAPRLIGASVGSLARSKARNAAMRPLKPGSRLPRVLLLLASDLVSVLLLFAITSRLSGLLHWGGGAGAGVTGMLAPASLLVAGLSVLVLGLTGGYAGVASGRPVYGLGRLLIASALATWASWVLASILGLQANLGQFSAALVLLPVAGLLARRLVGRAHARPERVVIVGTRAMAQRVVELTQRHREAGLEVVGCVDDATAEGWSSDLPLLGGVDDLRAVVADYEIERVIVAFAHRADDEVMGIVRRCADDGVRIDVVPRLFDVAGREPQISSLGGLALVNVSGPPGSRISDAIKRAIDIAVAGALLVATAPLMAGVALLVALDNGRPMLFKQKRVGRNGRIFEVLKFRTMTNAPSADGVAHLADMADEGGTAGFSDHEMQEVVATIKAVGDARVTRAGRILRKTSLDELPQLWSVLRGDMSLVGPRPLRQFEVAALSGWQRQRQAVRPGVTGLWQVLGRSEVGWEERMGLDCSYALHWSVRCDLDILARTVPALLKRTGAR